MNKNKRQSGFAIVEVLLVLVAVVVLGVITWRFLGAESAQNTITNETAQAPQVQAKNVLAEGEIIDLTADDLAFYDVEDLSQLPDVTPESFKLYMRETLEANSPDMMGCISVYKIGKMSTVNISGAAGGVDPQTRSADDSPCGGGAKIVWSFVDGAWMMSGFQSVPSCDSLKQAGIYSEFMPSCTVPVPPYELQENPNGSIKDRQ